MPNADLVLDPKLMLTEVANAWWYLQSSSQLAADGWQRRLSMSAELMAHIKPERTLQHETLARREVATLLSADQKPVNPTSQVLP